MDAATAVVEWVNTFSLNSPCNGVEDLSDGTVFADVLAEIADDDGIAAAVRRDVGNNWAMALGNLKKVMSNLVVFYREILCKVADFGSVNLQAAAREKDPEELLVIARLLIGAAVMCSNKAQYIGAIMQMPVEGQAVLQQLIQQAMGQVRAIDSGDADGAESDKDDSQHAKGGAGEASAGAASASAAAAAAAVTLSEALADNSALKKEVAALRERLSQENASATARGAADMRTDKLQRAIDDLRSQLEEKDGEIDDLRHKAESMEAKRDQEVRLRTKMEMELRQMADELDIAQANAAQLAQAEEKLARFKLRVDEVGTLRAENARLEASQGRYLEKLLELEGVAEELKAAKRRIEHYKDQAVDLERLKFEAQSAATLKDAENTRLKQDLDDALRAKTFFEDELISLREQTAGAVPGGAAAAGAAGSGGANGHSDFGLFESSSELREKAMRLQRENEQLKARMSDGEGGSSEQVSLLRSQLDDALRMRDARAEDALTAKRRAAELEMETTKLRELIAAIEGAPRTAAEEGRENARIKELAEENERLKSEAEAKAALEMTLRQMTESLKQKETQISDLEGAATKKDTYIKNSLEHIERQKAEYEATLAAHEKARKKLKDEVEHAKAQRAADRASFKREEKLMISAMYELGMEQIERRLFQSVAAAAPESSSSSASWLQRQRAEAKRTALNL